MSSGILREKVEGWFILFFFLTAMREVWVILRTGMEWDFLF